MWAYLNQWMINVSNISMKKLSHSFAIVSIEVTIAWCNISSFKNVFCTFVFPISQTYFWVYFLLWGFPLLLWGNMSKNRKTTATIFIRISRILYFMASFHVRIVAFQNSGLAFQNNSVHFYWSISIQYIERSPKLCITYFTLLGGVLLYTLAIWAFLSAWLTHIQPVNYKWLNTNVINNYS